MEVESTEEVENGGAARGRERVEEGEGAASPVVDGSGSAGHPGSTEASGHVQSGPVSSVHESWIQKTFEQVLTASHLKISLQDAQAVTVLALERYMVDIPSPGKASRPPVSTASQAPAAPLPPYYYDVTVADGVWQEKCHLAPRLNFLVHKNILRCGSRVKIMQCSYMYNEKKLHYGFMCIERLEIVGVAEIGDVPREQKEYREKSTMPLKSGKKHYLPLWNNEDPYGDIWLENKQSQDVLVDGKLCIAWQ